MSAPAKLGAFALALALAMGAGAALGAAVGPLGDDGPTRSTPTTVHATHPGR